MAEFKIGSLRYTWKGPWITATFYNRDAVVSFNGKTYVCLIPHTSSNFYADAEYVDPVAGPTPYWVLMLEGKTWRGNWTPNTPYTLGNLVLFAGVVYESILNHTSNPVTINLANWKIYVAVNSTWVKDYAPSFNYKIGEVAKYNGIVYRCTATHTSSSQGTINLANWEPVNVGIEYRGTWSNSPSVKYRLNDIVKFASNLWIATIDHTSSAPFDEANWNIWLPGLDYGTTWDSGTVYQIGDVVVYGGYSYTNNITNNINVVPSVNAIQWTLLTTGYEVKDEWDPLAAYKVGSVVRRSGNTFVAIQDNSQDPTGIPTVKSYVASGSSGTTVKLSNTTGLVKGMLVSGVGFDKAQFINSVVDANTITVSVAPYDTITNGVDITFSGVAAGNWELISTGVRWRNRWAPAEEYVIGDVVVWGKATYYCVNTGISNITNRPDIDSNNLHWVIYFNHDKFNALTQPGDIVVVTPDGNNAALEIGLEGFLLKSVAGVPTWKNVFQTPAVYYTAPTGTDAITSGDTWDNPFRSIKYACEQIAQGKLNPELKSQLTNDKADIVSEVQQWVISQIDQSVAPFSSTDLIDTDKTGRDTSFLIDAILYDLTRGGNSQTIAYTYSFFDRGFSNQYATPGVAAQMPQFIATLNHAFETLLAGLNVSPQVVIDINSLKTIIITALTEGNTLSIPAENQGLTATLMVKTGTYKETLPIVVPANTAINGDELRGVVVKPQLVIDTVAVRTRVTTNLITVGTTAGMANNVAVQFVSINPISNTNTVFGGLESGRTYYVIGASITSTTFSVSEEPDGDAVSLVNFVSQMRVYGGDALKDMFYMQNGTGMRNMTLSGLLGTLTTENAFLTRRPTGGAYVSLDPGTGPTDTKVWIYRKSPYIQNVTTFGIGCTGLKIDGTLHDGGNKSIVCNDFTQIVSDGIGVWCTGPDSLCEAVSVFSYYAYSGYFAEDGGRIRATNGNSSYGTFGVVAEGFNINEVPISGTVDNRYFEATATPVSSLGAAAEILKLQYSHAGEKYFSDVTNMLTYSNLFTNWASDGNVTLIQSITSPTGQSNAWLATGNTSGTDGSYFYQDLTVSPPGAVYTNISADSQTGGGVGATFDVTVTSTQYIVTVNTAGSGYVVNNELQINGANLGGLNGINDLVITVASLSGSGVNTINIAGVVQVGSIQRYVASVFCKKGTSPTFDITATFTGYSTATSGVSINLNTQVITPITLTGGFAPTTYSAVPVSGQPGWFRLSFEFYDTSALNSSLQIRLYPRGRLGNSGFTLLYGAQLEVGNTLGFYLDTSSERFSAYANYSVVGAGTGVVLIGDETRSDSTFQTRILEVDNITGGTGYKLASNNAQSGDAVSISIAGSDTEGEKTYLGMRIFINSGVGTGQYGVISTFDTVTKLSHIIRESFAPVAITNTSASTNEFSLALSVDVNSLYINQPVQFIPTKYVINPTNVSQRSITVTQTIGGTINTITVTSTARLTVDMPITFSGTTFGGVTSNFTYYVTSIIDDAKIQISTVLGGPVTLLNNTTSTMLLNYPSNTSIITGDTATMAVNLPIYFTGKVFSNIVPGQTYFINEIFGGTSFTISTALAVAAVTATTAITNNVTTDDTGSLRSLNPILFSGSSPFGGLGVGVKYYINHIVDNLRITVSSTVIDTTASLSRSSSNLVTAASTSNFQIGNPITLTGTTFGGIVNDRVYFIHYVASDTTFSISNTSTPLSISATQTFVTTNNLTVSSSTNLMPLNPITFFGTPFGGISTTSTYYISRIINSTTIRIATGIITVEATATEDTSNLITVTTTSGIVANNPIIFGGPTMGGLESLRVYFVSAINDETTLTVSATQGGGAVSLTSATGLMTARTTSSDVVFPNATGTMTAVSRFTGTAINLSTGVGECSVRTTGPSITLTTSTGILTGTSTTVKEILTAATGSMIGTYTVPTFGGITEDTSYYVKSITPGLTNVFTISTTPAGPTFQLLSGSGSMQMAEQGWDHINPGTPLAPSFDSTTVYSIEPLLTYSKPAYVFSTNANAITLAPGTTYTAMEYGSNKFVALPNSGLSIASSVDGNDWTQRILPSGASWTDLAYGNNYWVIISSGGVSIPGSKVLYSNSDLVTWKTAYLPSIGTWSKVVYGNGRFVAVGASASAVSTNFGSTWTAGSINADTWIDVTYGSGKFVAISPTNSRAAYSTNGTTWTVVSLPSSSSWSSVAFGNGRFVAISSTSSLTAYSFDGATWYQSRYTMTGDRLSYGNGVFLATPLVGPVGYTSEDGIVWVTRVVPPGMGTSVFGYNNQNKGRFIAVTGQNTVSIVQAGSQTKARADIFQGKIRGINEWDPGSNYSSPPTLTIEDSNATLPATVQSNIGDGVLGNPTFFNRGVGYNTASTSIFITGDGYAENLQIGFTVIFENLTRLPSPGDNLIIAGNEIVYKVTEAAVLDGTVVPSIRGAIGLSPSMTTLLAPDQGTGVIIRTKYSQVRLTNHDYLNIGYGNFEESNYPRLPENTLLAPQNEAIESNFGRVFYSATDQDGNFRVGKLFAVEQATGIVTLSASQFGLAGLSELKLGGIAVGGNSVIITQFSVDSTFVANSNTIISTQRAIKGYLGARLSQGGSNTFTGNLIAGTVSIGGPDVIKSTIPEGNEGSQVRMPNKVNVNGFPDGGWDGDGMALAFFVSCFADGTATF
jgi:hypothetical protein